MLIITVTTHAHTTQQDYLDFTTCIMYLILLSPIYEFYYHLTVILCRKFLKHSPEVTSTRTYTILLSRAVNNLEVRVQQIGNVL